MKNPKRNAKGAGSGKTETVKYRGLYFMNILGFSTFLILAVGYAIIAYYQWNNFTSDVRGLFGFLALLILAFFVYFLCQVVRSKAYAMIQDDGIHIVSKDGGELTSIAWEDVQDCVFVPYSRVAFLMLVMRWDVTFRGMPIASYHGYPRPKDKEVKAYLLDRQMEKLARGKMTPEELHELPVIMLYLGCRSYDLRRDKLDFTKWNYSALQRI